MGTHKNAVGFVIEITTLVEIVRITQGYLHVTFAKNPQSFGRFWQKSECLWTIYTLSANYHIYWTIRGLPPTPNSNTTLKLKTISCIIKIKFVGTHPWHNTSSCLFIMAQFRSQRMTNQPTNPSLTWNKYTVKWAEMVVEIARGIFQTNVRT